MNTSEAFEYSSRRSRFAVHFELARSRLEEMEEYCHRFERWMAQECADIRAQVSERTKLMDVHDRRTQLYVECLAEDIAQVEETFPQIFRTSLFIQCCSNLEHTLIRLARRHESELPVKFDKVSRDAGIRRARTYLEEHADVAFPKRPYWNALLLLNDLRNVAVHANRTVVDNGGNKQQQKNRAVVKKALRRWPKEVSIDRFHQITLSAAFVPRVLSIHRRFLKQLRSRVLARAAKPSTTTAGAETQAAAA